ncbi:MAG: hypothetical protein R3B96_12505 [Pirellulaceae bacterium]
MNDSSVTGSSGSTFRLAPVRDLAIPLVAAAIPAGLFALLGLATRGLAQPGAQPPVWLVVTMAMLEILGIVAMAFVILMRLEFGRRHLALRTDGYPEAWRKAVLFTSVAFILLFDILTNVAAAFAGASPLLLLAVPAFLGYVACVRIAFAGL